MLLRPRDGMAAGEWVRGALARLAFGLLAITACGGGNATNYAAAGIGLGATVVASGINRALTGSCWAVCAKGFYCDHESGLCQRGECDPSCRDGEYCVKEDTGDFRCAIPAGTYAFSQSKPPPPPSESDADAGATAPLAPYVDGGAFTEDESVDAGADADGGFVGAPIPDAGSDAPSAAE